MDKKTAAKKAIKAAGGQTEMAGKLAEAVPELTRDTAYWRIQKWAYHGIPPAFVIIVEKISGVSRHEIRPDIYPVEAA